MRSTFVLALACVLAAVGMADAQSVADDYPQRPVTFLCPFPAGGGTNSYAYVDLRDTSIHSLDLHQGQIQSFPGWGS